MPTVSPSHTSVTWAVRPGRWGEGRRAKGTRMSTYLSDLTHVIQLYHVIQNGAFQHPNKSHSSLNSPPALSSRGRRVCPPVRTILCAGDREPRSAHRETCKMCSTTLCCALSPPLPARPLHVRQQ
eukprot:6812092-Prymnesium_polylepis.1